MSVLLSVYVELVCHRVQTEPVQDATRLCILSHRLAKPPSSDKRPSSATGINKRKAATKKGSAVQLHLDLGQVCF